MSDHPAAPVLDDAQLDVLVDQLASRLTGPMIAALVADKQLAPQLAAELAPQLARAMRELPDPQPQRDEWESTAETADRFALTTDWLYRHADELGVLRLGDGPKARLRFSPARVERALSARVDGESSQAAEAPPPAAKAAPTRRPARAGANRVPLLPYRGQDDERRAAAGGVG